jgi:hypothetical protein
MSKRTRTTTMMISNKESLRKKLPIEYRLLEQLDAGL